MLAVLLTLGSSTLNTTVVLAETIQHGTEQTTIIENEQEQTEESEVESTSETLDETIDSTEIVDDVSQSENALANDSPIVERTGEELAKRLNPMDVQGLSDNEIIALAQYLYGDYANQDTSFHLSVQNDKGEVIDIPFARTRATGTAGEWILVNYTASKGAWTAWGEYYQKMKIDGTLAYCVQPGTIFVPGAGFTSQTSFSGITPTQQKNINNIMNFGAKDSDSDNYIVATQFYIWEAMGYTVQTNLSNYTANKQKIDKNLSDFKVPPSFHNQTKKLKVGETITLTDSNGVLSTFYVESNTANLDVKINGNKLELTAKSSSKDGYVLLNRKTFYSGTQFFWVNSNGSQSVTTGGAGDPTSAIVRVEVEQNGDFQLQKVDENGEAIAGVKFDVTRNDTGKTANYTTGSDGKVTIKDIPAGTKITAKETFTPAPYILNSTPKTTTVKAGETVTLKFTNKEQLANLTAFKEDEETGTKAQGSASLNNAVYGLYDSKDNLIEKMTLSSKDGAYQATVKGLPLGNYYLKELEAPYGYNLNESKIPVELTYAGQTASVAVHEKTVKDKVIKGSIKGYKFGSKNLIKTMTSFFSKNDDVKPPLKDVEITATSKTTGEAFSVVTDENGYWELNDLVFDTYVVAETKGVDGYKLFEPFEVTITEEGQEHFFLLEDKIIESKLRVYKFDEETEKPLENAQFKIFDRWANEGEGAFLSMYAPNTTEMTDTFISGKNGEIVLTESLPWGIDRYELHEVEAPEGYLPLTEPIVFSVTEDNADAMISIDVPNKRKPVEIGTKATDLNGLKAVDPTKEVVLQDIIDYKWLLVGEEYEIVTKAVDKQTGEVIAEETTTFIPETMCGEVTVTLTLNGSELAGRDIVFYEYFNRNGNEEGKHEDIEDEGQTVHINKPTLATKATFENEAKEITTDENVVVKDTIEFTDLVVGNTYDVLTKAVRKSDGTVIKEEVSKYTATAVNGSFDVFMTLNGFDLQGEDIVFFEYVSIEKTEIVNHEDINDKGQTVRFNKLPVEVLPNTGEQAKTTLTIAGIFMLGVFGLGAYWVSKKSKSETTNDKS